MVCTDATPACAVYRPRNPRASVLYQCVRRNADELRQAGRVHRVVEDQVLDRFLDCADLHKGFARVHCDECGHEYLLVFSCKTRCFCPSCHQKRMLIFGEWVEEEALAPVPHRWHVFTVPKVRGAPASTSVIAWVSSVASSAACSPRPTGAGIRIGRSQGSGLKRKSLSPRLAVRMTVVGRKAT